MPKSNRAVVIEPARAEDREALADLLGLLFGQEADFTPDREKQLRGLDLILSDPRVGQIFVARCSRDHHRVTGMVSLLFTVSTAEGGWVALLEDLVVAPEARGAGMGARLVERAIDFAEERSLTRISLLTDRTNRAAQALYARYGFSQSGMLVLRRAVAPRAPGPGSLL